MPKLNNPKKRGDLLAKVEIRVPKNLGAEQKKKFKELQKSLK
jgi:DnaJ-class molecular chaperone